MRKNHFRGSFLNSVKQDVFICMQATENIKFGEKEEETIKANKGNCIYRVRKG